MFPIAEGTPPPAGRPTGATQAPRHPGTASEADEGALEEDEVAVTNPGRCEPSFHEVGPTRTGGE